MNTPGQSGSASAPPASNTSLIMVAVLMGLVTMGITFAYVAQIKKATRLATVTVYTLNKDKEPGDKLTTKDFDEVQIPRKLMDGLPGAIVSIDGDRKVLTNQLGEEFTRKAQQGEWLSRGMFSGQSINTEEIDSGYVAVALPVNSRTNVPGLLRPDMYIDILGTFTQPGQPPRTEWVIKKIKVLATGTNTNAQGSRGSSGYSSITVMATPLDATALLTGARFIGREGFDVVLRRGDADEPSVGINKEVKKLVGLK